MTARARSHRPAAAMLALLLSVAVVSAQTPVTAPDNKYSVQEDVQLGREAARQAREQLPMMRDDLVVDYVRDLGGRLVASIPASQRHAGFQYSFDVVNVREINAFALPGGPMFVNRGMIEAAKTEAEVAGVLAHEISHVSLRHGTAQAGKATKYQIGELLGAVAGAIVGGTAGQVIAQGTSFGLGTAFMRFGREYERQADIQGAQIMARAGYDPRDMANMFKTIEAQSGGSGPEWLSDHPNPANRSAYINQEAQALRVSNPVRDTAAFDRVRARLKSLPKAPTMEEATRKGRRTSSSGGGESRPPAGRVAAPATRYTQYNEGDVFRVSVPSNWRELPASNAVTFAPEGGYGAIDGQNVFTHGIEIGLARNNDERNVQAATEELLASLAEANPGLKRRSNYQRRSVAGRAGLQTTLSNVSEATRQDETIQLVTALLPDGTLLYAVGVAPAEEFRSYQPHFGRVVDSIRMVN